MSPKSLLTHWKQNLSSLPDAEVSCWWGPSSWGSPVGAKVMAGLGRPGRTWHLQGLSRCGMGRECLLGAHDGAKQNGPVTEVSSCGQGHMASSGPIAAC